MPWVWTRFKLAEVWHCKPWEVDEAIEDGREDEVVLAIRLLNLQAEYQR